jgi:Domain of Unknown Function (DUF1206)
MASQAGEIVRSPWMAKIAAIGFFVYGSVYVLVGALAAKVAMGTGGRITNPQGAIAEVARQPFGGALLAVITIGLFAYSSWRLTQAIADPENYRTGWKGIATRGGRLISAVSYGALGVFAFEVATSARRPASGDESWALRLITEPLGAVLGTLVGLVIVAVGVTQFYKAFTADFGEPLHESRMSRPERTWGLYAARLGFCARGVVFTMTGAYLLYAVFDANPRRAKSVEELLSTLLRLPYGNWIMGLVAAGLAGYGLFMILVAMHRRHPY